jgi:hypothetical protein
MRMNQINSFDDKLCQNYFILLYLILQFHTSFNFSTIKKTRFSRMDILFITDQFQANQTQCEDVDNSLVEVNQAKILAWSY